MAIKGLKIPYVAKYTDNGNGTVTYSDGVKAEKAVSYSVELEEPENNPLYGDDEIAEDDNTTFAGGTLTLSTTDFTQPLSALLLGINIVKVTGTGEEQIDVGSYDRKRKAVDVGFGVIEVHQINNVNQYRAVLLTRVAFNIPNNTAETKGESIEWQTPELSANLKESGRVDDKFDHPWMMDAWFETEADADAWLKSELDITEPEAAKAAAPAAKAAIKSAAKEA